MSEISQEAIDLLAAKGWRVRDVNYATRCEESALAAIQEALNQRDTKLQEAIRLMGPIAKAFDKHPMRNKFTFDEMLMSGGIGAYDFNVFGKDYRAIAKFVKENDNGAA